jgi:hypothetical protein
MLSEKEKMRNTGAVSKVQLAMRELADTKRCLNTHSCYRPLFLGSDKFELTESRINVGTNEPQ